MSDLIDRQALLDECLNHYEVGNIEQNCTMDWICKTVRNFPAAATWHRVEDELPDDGEWAIFTNGKVVSVERFKVDAYNHFFPASEWFDFEDAIAWMPLPELPKEDA